MRSKIIQQFTILAFLFNLSNVFSQDNAYSHPVNKQNSYSIYQEESNSIIAFSVIQNDLVVMQDFGKYRKLEVRNEQGETKYSLHIDNFQKKDRKIRSIPKTPIIYLKKRNGDYLYYDISKAISTNHVGIINGKRCNQDYCLFGDTEVIITKGLTQWKIENGHNKLIYERKKKIFSGKVSLEKSIFFKVLNRKLYLFDIQENKAIIFNDSFEQIKSYSFPEVPVSYYKGFLAELNETKAIFVFLTPNKQHYMAEYSFQSGKLKLIKIIQSQRGDDFFIESGSLYYLMRNDHGKKEIMRFPLK